MRTTCGRVLGVPAQSVALLTALFLRGAQTVGELRINAERLHRFGDLSAVQAFLEELAERPAGALVRELPRTPGSRETRWAHLLSGAPALPAVEPATSSAAGGDGQQVTLGELWRSASGSSARSSSTSSAAG